MFLRAFEIFVAVFVLLVCFCLFVCLWIIRADNSESVLFRQKRLGLHQSPFVMVKFRTMRSTCASVPTHLANASDVTKVGQFLRKTKLDELPQFWNVLIGQMSIVGPRPGLPNHSELIEARKSCRVFDVRPGITGLSQISNIDMSTPKLLAETDAEMIRTMSLAHYFNYIFLTLTGKGNGDRVR